MPIAGLSEKRRLPRLGKIRIGELVESKKKPGVFYPHATEYFVVPPEVGSAYGAKPTSLEIMFPIDKEETFASQYLRAYSKSRGLVCKGDGETASRLIDVTTKRGEEGTGVITGVIAKHDAKDVEWVEGITCPGRDCSYYQAKECKEIMNLQFLIPNVPGLGIWQLDTSSYNSILNINSALALIRTIFGTVAGIPLQLTVEPIEVTPAGKKKTVYVLNLRTKATLKELGQKRGQLALGPQLPTSDDEMPETLFLTVEQEEAKKADEEAEAQAQAKKDTDALYGTAQPVTLPQGHEVKPEPVIVVAKEEIIPAGEIKSAPVDKSLISSALQATIMDTAKALKLSQSAFVKIKANLFPDLPPTALSGLTQAQGWQLLLELRKLGRSML